MNKKTILLIEDEMPLQDAAKAKLESSGFQVVTARTAEQALGYLTDLKKVDAIWLDHYLLGKETGLDFVAKVKNDKVKKKIPIFVVSNTASPDKVKSYLAFGVNKYYAKIDYRLEQIIKDIGGLLKKIEGNNE